MLAAIASLLVHEQLSPGVRVVKVSRRLTKSVANCQLTVGIDWKPRYRRQPRARQADKLSLTERNQRGFNLLRPKLSKSHQTKMSRRLNWVAKRGRQSFIAAPGGPSLSSFGSAAAREPANRCRRRLCCRSTRLARRLGLSRWDRAGPGRLVRGVDSHRGGHSSAPCVLSPSPMRSGGSA